MFFDGVRLAGFCLFFLGAVLITVSEFLFLLIVSEINSRRPAAQRIEILDMVFMGRFRRREKTRMIMRAHRETFPGSWKPDGFDNTQFLGALSAFTGFALIVIIRFSSR
jgi:hypothetical protein